MKTKRPAYRLCPYLIATILNLPNPLSAQDNPPPPDAAFSDVKESVTYDLGDQLLTVQRVTEKTIPITLPQPETFAPATSISSPERLAHRAAMKRIHFLSLGGMVYRLVSGQTRSLITLHTTDGASPVEFWSSIDWNLMRIGNFTSPQGETYSLNLMLTPIDIAKITQLLAAHGRTYTAPVIPSFPAGPATYHILSGAPSPQVIAALNDLHAIHDRDYDSLMAAWQKREDERKADEVAAKLPQPPPPDIVSQYREMTPEELKNP